MQGFPNGVNLWRGVWPKWPKTAWKLQNQHFGGKTVWGSMGAQVNFLGNGGIRKKKTLEVTERIKTILSTFIWDKLGMSIN